MFNQGSNAKLRITAFSQLEAVASADRKAKSASREKWMAGLSQDRHVADRKRLAHGLLVVGANVLVRREYGLRSPRLLVCLLFGPSAVGPVGMQAHRDHAPI